MSRGFGENCGTTKALAGTKKNRQGHGRSDPNALSSILKAEPSAGHEFVIQGSDSAELLALPGTSDDLMQDVVERSSIRVDWNTSDSLWKAAGEVYGTYALRRRRSGGGAPRRILADFLIGAHAQQRGATLVTLDDRHYWRGFPGLRVFVP